MSEGTGGPPGADAGRGALPPGTPVEWYRSSVGRHLSVAAKSVRAVLAHRLAEAGSTFGTWTVLAALQASGPLIQRELAERLFIEGPTLTRQLTRMESDGLVVRTRSETDRRAATVELTDRGRRLFRRLATVVIEGNAQLLDGFSAAEIETLRGMLDRIQRNATAGRPGRPADAATAPEAPA